jgi:ferredoxin
MFLINFLSIVTFFTQNFLDNRLYCCTAAGCISCGACVQACPTGIDIPSFIRKIATGNLKGSARDILQQNIMGAVCARVCPTEVLCEGACVRNTAEDRPVAIGALQQHRHGGAEGRPHFDELTARGNVPGRLHPHQVESVGKGAEQEPPGPIGDSQCAGRPEGGDGSPSDRGAEVIEHDTLDASTEGGRDGPEVQTVAQTGATDLGRSRCRARGSPPHPRSRPPRARSGYR